HAPVTAQSAHMLRRASTSVSTVFLLRRCAAPRALPSFPTRRSSDLRGGGVEQGQQRVADELHDRAAVVENARHPGRVVAVEHLQDRKSTRLNSSHVKISYAVFCLKKKTKPDGHGVIFTQRKTFECDP